MLYHNEVSFVLLSIMHPVGHAVANSMKSTVVLAIGSFFMGKTLDRQSISGIMLSFFGLFFYREVHRWNRKEVCQDLLDMDQQA